MSEQTTVLVMLPKSPRVPWENLATRSSDRPELPRAASRGARQDKRVGASGSPLWCVVGGWVGGHERDVCRGIATSRTTSVNENMGILTLPALDVANGQERRLLRVGLYAPTVKILGFLDVDRFVPVRDLGSESLPQGARRSRGCIGLIPLCQERESAPILWSRPAPCA